MDSDHLWTEIDDQRRRTVALLAGLEDEEWTRPSLCGGWTVRDVAAHLTIQQAGLLDVLGMIARSPAALLRRDMHAMINAAALRQAAALTTGEMVSSIEAMIGSRRHNLGVTPFETLIDICVHSQDIAVPLHRQLPLSPAAATVVANRVWEIGWPWFARRRFEGVRLIATDVDWRAGAGSEVSGPIDALVLVLTARPVGAERLTGPGLARLPEDIR